MTSVAVIPGGSANPAADIVFVVGETLVTAESDFKAYAGGITSLESDLLTVASAVFAADRAVARGEGQDLARTIELKIPVVNIARLLPIRSMLENLLYKLSQDAWSITFQQVTGAAEQAQSTSKGSGKTLLFSGGADSLAAAVEFGKKGSVELISHRTHNVVTDRAQRDLVEFLNHNGYNLPHAQFFVSSRTPVASHIRHDAEESQRTRSFVFLTLGALAARRRGNTEVIFLAENGQMAIHLPLTQGRIGALSTHTAHPDVLHITQDLLSRMLEHDIKIANPYVYQTKAEVVGRVSAKPLTDALWKSNSCWRNARLTKGSHCGSCVPCLVRRIAIEHLILDKTIYARDPWTENLLSAPPEDLARRNMADLGEFITRFKMYSDEEVLSEWPELFSDTMDAGQVISMYRRFADEAVGVLKKYPMMQAFVR